jgi:beta-glucosidase
MLNVVSAASTREAQKLAVEHSRLGIPMIFGYDVIHGFKTIMPIPLGEAASWDLEAIELSARVAARESAAAGVHWTFAPMVDITRDARWGRVMEGAGEDPYLGSVVAKARIRGFQGTDLSESSTIAACAKHFAGYGFAEGGRDYNTVDISEYTLRNVVLPPFKASVDAGVATFMNAFNEIGGIPATAYTYLTRDILKGEWQYPGFVVSDWASIYEMIDHGYAEDEKHASYLSIVAGSDMDMEGYCYENHLADLVKSGAISEDLIDDAVRRILRVKFMLGIMDDPYKYCNPEKEQQEILSKENLSIARDVARKSIVLLKNERDILPLGKSVRSIAVIGPLADDKDTPLGNWRAQATPNSAVSVLEGIREAVDRDVDVMYAKGCDLSIGERSFSAELTLNQVDISDIPDAVDIAKKADVVVLVLGEDSQQSGEGRSQAGIGLAGVQPQLLEQIYAANPNTVVVLMNGRPLELSWMAGHVPAIVEAWHLGSEAGHAIADVLFGHYNPSGKLPMSFPRHVGQLPLYYNQKTTGRPGPKSEVFWSHYTDEKNDALYPFGFGLSYTTFGYGPITLSSAEMSSEDYIEVSVKVTNSGNVAGTEVAQLYLRDLVASMTRPVKELKKFERLYLNPGESKQVKFTLTRDDLSFYNAEGNWAAEPGVFKVMIGTNSRDLREAEFRYIGEQHAGLKSD